MNHRSKFQAGHGIYNCSVCTRRTRGDGESHQCDLCGQCMEIAEWDNHHNDNGTSPDAAEMATYNSLLKQIVKRGGEGERVKSCNEYIWNEKTEPAAITEEARLMIEADAKNIWTISFNNKRFTAATKDELAAKLNKHLIESNFIHDYENRYLQA